MSPEKLELYSRTFEQAKRGAVNKLPRWSPK